MSYSIFRWIHIVLTGIITIPVTLFIASGFIGINDSGEWFAAPEFLLLIGIWLIGVIMMFFNQTKVIGMIMTVLPSVFYVGAIIYFLIIPALTF